MGPLGAGRSKDAMKLFSSLHCCLLEPSAQTPHPSISYVQYLWQFSPAASNSEAFYFSMEGTSLISRLKEATFLLELKLFFLPNFATSPSLKESRLFRVALLNKMCARLIFLSFRIERSDPTCELWLTKHIKQLCMREKERWMAAGIRRNL